jgi:hypothetical protein
MTALLETFKEHKIDFEASIGLQKRRREVQRQTLYFGVSLKITDIQCRVPSTKTVAAFGIINITRYSC